MEICKGEFEKRKGIGRVEEKEGIARDGMGGSRMERDGMGGSRVEMEWEGVE